MTVTGVTDYAILTILRCCLHFNCAVWATLTGVIGCASAYARVLYLPRGPLRRGR
jgi:hypothetical protein